MLDTFRSTASSVSSGKNSPAWWRVMKPLSPRRPTADSVAQMSTSGATSGSRSSWLGLLWWRVCLSLHQPYLMPPLRAVSPPPRRARAPRRPAPPPAEGAGPLGAEDLAVGQVVGDQGDLGEGDGEE